MSSLDIKTSFSEDTTQAWRLRVEKELKGKAFEDYLVWKSIDGFEIDAWQNTRPSILSNLIALSEPWKIIEPVYISDAQAANKKALSALMTGAEGIWFQKGFLGAAAQVVTQGIDQSIAPVFIRGGNCFDPYQDFLKSGNEKLVSFDHSKIFLDGNRLRERGATIIDEIAILLSQAIESGKNQGFQNEPLFFTGIGNAFITEIAKIRALRWLWQSILAQEGKKPSNAFVLAKNLTIMYAQNDEHSNILRATSAAMSSIIGGASYVMIEPWDNHWKEENEFSARISRNIQNLLKEEARMDKNLNPADGSYLIENLTTIIAKAAWRKVQFIESQGGFTAFALSGELKNWLTSGGSDLINSFTSNKNALLGVSKYPPKTMIKESQRKSTHYALLPDLLSIPVILQNQEQ